MKYYKILNIDDKYGMCPSVDSYFLGKLQYSKLERVKRMEELFNHDKFWVADTQLVVDMHTYTNMPRFTDLFEHFLNRKSSYILVSPYFKQLLSHFHLGEHRFYPIELHFDRESKDKYGDISEVFYIFHALPVASSEYLDIITCNKQNTEYKATIFYVSEPLKVAIETAKLTGIGFAEVSDDELEYKPVTCLERIEQSQSAAANIQNLIGQKPLLADHEVLKEFDRQIERRDSILQKTDLAKNYYAERNIPMPSDPFELKIRQTEIALNVILPDDYKKMILEKTIPHTLGVGRYKGGYEADQSMYREQDPDYVFESLHNSKNNPMNLYQLGVGWIEYFPELVRSIAIGYDGIGNYLAYVLKADSEVELDERIVIVDHDPVHIEMLEYTMTTAPILYKTLEDFQSKSEEYSSDDEEY